MKKSNLENSSEFRRRGCWLLVNGSPEAAKLEELELEALQEFFENAYPQIMTDDFGYPLDEEA